MLNLRFTLMSETFRAVTNIRRVSLEIHAEIDEGFLYKSSLFFWPEF
jgi:hypothetical protein